MNGRFIYPISGVDYRQLSAYNFTEWFVKNNYWSLVNLLKILYYLRCCLWPNFYCWIFTSGWTFQSRTSTEIYSFVAEWERHCLKGCILLVPTSEQERLLIEIEASKRMILVTKLFKVLNDFFFVGRDFINIFNCT